MRFGASKFHRRILNVSRETDLKQINEEESLLDIKMLENKEIFRSSYQKTNFECNTNLSAIKHEILISMHELFHMKQIIRNYSGIINKTGN